MLEQAIKARYAEGTITLEELRKLQSIDDLAALAAPKLEDPSIARFDSKGQPLLFDRQEYRDRVVLTVRSTIAFKKERFWDKDRPPLAMEITVFRDPEKHFEIKQLWRGD